MNNLPSLKIAAMEYFSKGLNIIPVKGKQPLIQWDKWQNQKQSTTDFENLPWDQADGFAVIGGSKQNDGLHICALDYDVKNLPAETIAIGKELLRKFPATQTEETPSGGQHLVYLSRTRPKTVSVCHNQCGLELLGENKLIIMSPSKGYRRLNDNLPTEIEDIEALFTHELQKSGLAKSNRKALWFNNKDLQKPFTGKNPPCIESLLQEAVSEGNRNEVAIRLSSYLLNFKQLPQEKVRQKLQEWNSNNKPPLEDSELHNIFESSLNGKYVYGCEDPIIGEHCNSDTCHLKNNKTTSPDNSKTMPFVELPEGRLAEQGFDGKEVYFLVYDVKSDSVQKQNEIKLDSVVLKPLVNDEITLRLTLLPSAADEYENDQKLLEDIMSFLNKWHEAPSQRDRKLDALYVMLTYISDLLPRVPYRQMIGALGRGKSAWMETVGSICYRPIRLAGCDTDKAICRRLNIWRGTALIDEADFGKSDLYAFITKILNMGYDRKTGYYQRCDDQDPNKVITYCVFGPKLLASREPYKDMALESRCIKTIARENNKQMPLFRMDTFSAEALALRNKLILWRFHKYHDVKKRIFALETCEFAASLNINSVSSRIKEILAPLSLVSDDFKSQIPDLASELDEELKNDRDFQLEMEFNEALIKTVDEAKNLSDGSYGSYGHIGSPQLVSPSLQDFTEDKQKALIPKNKEDIVYHIPLVNIAKKILGKVDPEPKELISVSKNLSNMIRTRLGLKVIQGTGGRRLVEVPEAYIRTVTTLTTVTKPKCKVIKIQ